MDNKLLEFLASAATAIRHPGLRFLTVFAGIVTAFLLMLATLTGDQLHHHVVLFVVAFVVLILVLLVVAIFLFHLDRVERELKREYRMSDELKQLLRDRVQEEIERQAEGKDSRRG